MLTNGGSGQQMLSDPGILQIGQLWKMGVQHPGRLRIMQSPSIGNKLKVRLLMSKGIDGYCERLTRNFKERINPKEYDFAEEPIEST